jgi:hypothetical protein
LAGLVLAAKNPLISSADNVIKSFILASSIGNLNGPIERTALDARVSHQIIEAIGSWPTVVGQRFDAGRVRRIAIASAVGSGDSLFLFWAAGRVVQSSGVCGGGAVRALRFENPDAALSDARTGHRFGSLDGSALRAAGRGSSV